MGIRVIGVNFSEILIKGRKFSSSSRLALVIRVRVIEVLLYVNHGKSSVKLNFILEPRLVNNLPLHLREVDSIVIFKTLLNDIIF